jgi:[protein-PII] uridylyltransferase
MLPGSHFRPAIIESRRKLAEGREKLRAQHDRGSPGIQVCARLTDLFDTILLDLYHDALSLESGPTQSLITLVPHGGYGRRDVAPYSDVDLMLLHEQGAAAEIQAFVRRFSQSIYDTGLDLGFSTRTPRQACKLALQDPMIFTSLVESRFLGGSVQLFARFFNKFRADALRHSSALITRIEAARREERHQYGETIYLLRPNIKRSRGGLRDLQLIRWIGFARYGEAEYKSLERAAVLHKEDRQRIRDAREFLLRLRNELHFHAGKSEDQLDKDAQVRLAEKYGFPGDDSVLPVENFMRQYIEHTSDVRYVTTYILSKAKQRVTLLNLLGPLFAHRVGKDFLVGTRFISATRHGLVKVCGNLEEILRLMDLSNRYNKRIDQPTWRAIRQSLISRPHMDLSPRTSELFLSLLSQPPHLASLLRRLHELRALEKLVPAVAHARHLMQFNDYHKYTVDEHSIRAVEAATSFKEMDGPLGEAYAEIRNKRTLHLALLIHDLGKGFDEDHSEVGRRLAAETAEYLGIPKHETEILCFLVHKHLRMSHLAQRRDINDDAVVTEFAVEVGSLEVLKMMFVLTCADLAAVGPGVLNSWKLDLITQLYLRTLEHLAGESVTESVGSNPKVRSQMRKLVADAPNREWWYAQIKALPRTYLSDTPPETIINQLRQLQDLAPTSALAWGRFLPTRAAVEYTIGTHETITPGIFYKLTGALTSKGLQILSAEIHPLTDRLVLDRFFVIDLDYSGPPPPERIEEINQTLVTALCNPSDVPPTFRRIWSKDTAADVESVGHLPTQVRVDNSTSDQYTILDIFAHDQMGLLYTITRKIFELELSVHVAKIGTYLDQVVDVFYVTDRNGAKILDEHRIGEIQRQIGAALDELVATT